MPGQGQRTLSAGDVDGDEFLPLPEPGDDVPNQCQRTVSAGDVEHVSPSISDDDDTSTIFDFPCLVGGVSVGGISVPGSVNNVQQQDQLSTALEYGSRHSDDECSVDETIHDVEPEAAGVGIVICSKDTSTKSKNRKLPCLFCEKSVFHMSRHLDRKHSEEPLVAAALATSVKPDKALALRKIQFSGIYKHNVGVLQKNTGVLIVGRAPATTREASDYLPCEFCLQFFIRRELFRHCEGCDFRNPDTLGSGVSAGRALLYGSVSDGSDTAVMQTVFSRMRDDKLTAIAKSDRTIKQLGTMLLRKLGARRALDISAKMRELARLLVIVRQNDDDTNASLDSVMTSQGFDRVLSAIDVVGQPTTSACGRRIFQKPGIVIKLGASLVKCAQLKRGQGLRDGDSVAVNEAEDFLALHKYEYTDNMSSAAHASYRIKGNTLSDYPEESDLQLLREYQKKKMTDLVDDVKQHPDEFIWRELAEVTMTRVLVFNARRGSEAAELTVEDYLSASSTVDPALVATMTTVEQQLLRRLMVIEVIGKRNRAVPILLTEDMTEAISALRESRETCGVLYANKFLFALPQTTSSHLGFYGTLRRVAHKAGLKKPHLLTTTRLRKHLATMAQVYNCAYFYGMIR